MISKSAGRYLSELSEDDLYKAFLKLEDLENSGHGDQLAHNFVTVWEPLEQKTVSDILNLIDSGIDEEIIMQKKFYVCHMWGDVEPKLYGPYSTPFARDRKAFKIWQKEGDNRGTIFQLNITEKGNPVVRAYTGLFFEYAENAGGVTKEISRIF